MDSEMEQVGLRRGWRPRAVGLGLATGVLLCCVVGLSDLGADGPSELEAVSADALRKALSAELQPRFRAEDRELKAELHGAGISDDDGGDDGLSAAGLRLHGAEGLSSAKFSGSIAGRYGENDHVFGVHGIGLKGDPTSALLMTDARGLSVQEHPALFSMLFGGVQKSTAGSSVSSTRRQRSAVPWSDSISSLAEKLSSQGLSPNTPRSSALPWGFVAQELKTDAVTPQFSTLSTKDHAGTRAVPEPEEAQGAEGQQISGRAVGTPHLGGFQAGEQNPLRYEHNGFVHEQGFNAKDMIRDPHAFREGEQQSLHYEHQGFVRSQGFRADDSIRDPRAFIEGEQEALAYQHNGLSRASAAKRSNINDIVSTAFAIGEHEPLRFEHQGAVQVEGPNVDSSKAKQSGLYGIGGIGPGEEQENANDWRVAMTVDPNCEEDLRELGKHSLGALINRNSSCLPNKKKNPMYWPYQEPGQQWTEGSEKAMPKNRDDVKLLPRASMQKLRLNTVKESGESITRNQIHALESRVEQSKQLYRALDAKLGSLARQDVAAQAKIAQLKGEVSMDHKGQESLLSRLKNARLNQAKINLQAKAAEQAVKHWKSEAEIQARQENDVKAEAEAQSEALSRTAKEEMQLATPMQLLAESMQASLQKDQALRKEEAKQRLALKQLHNAFLDAKKVGGKWYVPWTTALSRDSKAADPQDLLSGAET